MLDQMGEAVAEVRIPLAIHEALGGPGERSEASKAEDDGECEENPLLPRSFIRAALTTIRGRDFKCLRIEDHGRSGPTLRRRLFSRELQQRGSNEVPSLGGGPVRFSPAPEPVRISGRTESRLSEEVPFSGGVVLRWPGVCFLFRRPPHRSGRKRF